MTSEDLKGYDPYDILNSNVLGVALKGSNRYIQILATQLNRLNPFNVRKILKINKDYNSKAMALFSSAYLELYKKSKKEEFLKSAIFCLDWLEMNNCEKHTNEYGLGFTFDISMKTYSLE